jgi:hypothetical protein
VCNCRRYHAFRAELAVASLLELVPAALLFAVASRQLRALLARAPAAARPPPQPETEPLIDSRA